MQRGAKQGGRVWLVPVLAALGLLLLYLFLGQADSNQSGVNAAKTQYDGSPGGPSGGGTGTDTGTGAGTGGGDLGAGPGGGFDPCEGLPESCLFALLNGEEVVPEQGDPDGSGVMVFVPGSICFDFEFDAIKPPTFGSISIGKAGKPGKVFIPLFEIDEKDDELVSPVSECRKKFRGERAKKKHRGKRLEHKFFRRLERKPSRFHVHIENEEFVDGALRGQLQDS